MHIGSSPACRSQRRWRISWRSAGRHKARPAGGIQMDHMVKITPSTGLPVWPSLTGLEEKPAPLWQTCWTWRWQSDIIGWFWCQVMSLLFTNRPFIQSTLRLEYSTDLKGLDESPEQCSNALPFAEQFDQSQDSERAEESDGHFAAFFTSTLGWKKRIKRKFRTQKFRKYRPAPCQ